jgi:nucleoside-diphosphate-sugar epimerase
MADISHPIDLLPAFDWGPEVVFLTAAAVGRMTCEQAGSLAIATNLTGLNNVLQLCKRADATCVYFSSSEVYGPDGGSRDEAVSQPRPNNRYGLSKWLGEQLVEYEVGTGNLRAVTLRPCMIYDESEDLGDHRSAMIRFAANLARGRPIEVHQGTARGWLHISDAVRAFEAASRLERFTTINIGHPDVVPIAELAEMIRAELQADRELVQLKKLPPQMTLVKQPVLERQRRLLGFEPGVSLREGVRRVCDYQRRLVASESAAKGHVGERPPAPGTGILAATIEALSPSSLARLNP